MTITHKGHLYPNIRPNDSRVLVFDTCCDLQMLVALQVSVEKWIDKRVCAQINRSSSNPKHCTDIAYLGSFSTSEY